MDGTAGLIGLDCVPTAYIVNAVVAEDQYI
jgi:hypothetical protein